MKATTHMIKDLVESSKVQEAVQEKMNALARQQELEIGSAAKEKSMELLRNEVKELQDELTVSLTKLGDLKPTHKV